MGERIFHTTIRSQLFNVDSRKADVNITTDQKLSFSLLIFPSLLVLNALNNHFIFFTTLEHTHSNRQIARYNLHQTLHDILQLYIIILYIHSFSILFHIVFFGYALKQFFGFLFALKIDFSCFLFALNLRKAKQQSNNNNNNNDEKVLRLKSKKFVYTYLFVSISPTQNIEK